MNCSQAARHGIVRLQIGVLLVGERHLSSVLHLLRILGQQLGVDLDLGGSEGRGGDKVLFGC